MTEGTSEQQEARKVAGSSLEFNAQLLGQVQTTLQGAYDEGKALQANMDANSAALTSGAWAGTASQAFASSYAQFTEGYTKVMNALTSMQNSVNGAKNQLSAQEQAVMDQSKRILTGNNMAAQLNGMPSSTPMMPA
jgi:WXG100 family type VII secretion target